MPKKVPTANKPSASTSDTEFLAPVFIATNEQIDWSIQLQNAPGQLFLFLQEISPLDPQSPPILAVDITSSSPVVKTLSFSRPGLYLLHWSLLAGGNWETLVEIESKGTVVFRQIKSAANSSIPKLSGHCVVVVA